MAVESLKPNVAPPLEGSERRPLIMSVVADPAPLGLGAFAMTTFALSISNTNIWGAGVSAALALALVYGGTAQLLAGMWEFVRKNTFGALAFTSYGAFWISYYVLSRSILPGIKSPSDASVAVGVFLLGWTIFTAYMMIALVPGVGRRRGGFRAADGDLRAAHHRRLRQHGQRHQGRWLGRCGHRGGGVVRLVRRGGERHLQAFDRAHPAPR